MSQAEKIELEANGQETVEFEVEDNTDQVLVQLKSSEHDDVTTYPTWVAGDEDFPMDEEPMSEYPAELEPLGDKLKLNIRNSVARETEVTVAFREKKLVA